MYIINRRVEVLPFGLRALRVSAESVPVTAAHLFDLEFRVYRI